MGKREVSKAVATTVGEKKVAEDLEAANTAAQRVD